MSNQTVANEADRGVPIFIPEVSIESQRSSGYSDTLSAVNEFTDNSVEARATEMRIYYLPHRNGSRVIGHDIVVLDNGTGMDSATLQRVLAFGGGSRFDRKGIGRFAYGLPNAAISQGNLLEVYSWQQKNEVYKATLDVEAVKQSEQTTIEEPEVEDVPIELRKELFRPVGNFPDLTEQQGNLLTAANWPEHGTLVHVSKCDRLSWKSTKSYVENSWVLGRIYRYYMWMKRLKIYVNNRLIQSVDPLYLNPKARHSGATPFGPPIDIPIPVMDPALVEKDEDESKIPTVNVQVRLSRLPVVWMGDDRKVNGNQRKVFQHTQMSVLRADREMELAFGKLFGKSEEEDDNWWGGEIHIPPALDEPFGVTNNKQGLHPKQYVRDILHEKLWSIITQLRKDVRVDRREERRKRKGGEPTFLEKRLAEAEKYLGAVREVPVDSSYQEQLERELKKFATKHMREGETVDQAYERIKRSPYVVEEEDLPEGPFYRVEMYGTLIVLLINKRHQFYERVWEPLSAISAAPAGAGDLGKTVTDAGTAQDMVAAMLAAIARVEVEYHGRDQGEEWFRELRHRWSSTLQTFLGMLR